MMATRGTVLLWCGREELATLRAPFEALGGRVVPINAAEQLIVRLEEERPDVVVLPLAQLSPVIERALPRERHACAFVGLSGPTPCPVPEGFDVVLTALDAPDVSERLRMVLLLGRARREAHEAGREVSRLREATSAQVQRLSGFMLTILDRTLPGTTERSTQWAELAMQVAERFTIPDDMLPGLQLASRLREVGRLALPTIGVGAPGDPAWEWSITQAATTLLEPFPELAQAVELLTGMHENWDGTGQPGHLMSGQIPMRSRILRATHDYLIARQSPQAPAPSAILERMAEQSGTLYDPLVVVHLRAVIESASSPVSAGHRLYLPVPELKVGMVLAEDLYTDSGIKLLSRGTTLSGAALDVIVRRHGQEPMYRGVAIQRIVR